MRHVTAAVTPGVTRYVEGTYIYPDPTVYITVVEPFIETSGCWPIGAVMNDA